MRRPRRSWGFKFETAVENDHVLVPYYNIEAKTKFLEKGIVYDELSEEDKARYEEDFTDEDGEMPDFIPSPAVNEFIFNQNEPSSVHCWGLLVINRSAGRF